MSAPGRPRCSRNRGVYSRRAPRSPSSRRTRTCPVVDFGDGLVTPGLVDPHTHPVFHGTREDEFEMRNGDGPTSTSPPFRAASASR
jgi:imidazolonepropionase-like amidohydrolase